MSKDLFFKPTPLYKEFLLLDLIEKEPNLTQRVLSDKIGSSVSMINTYIEEYELKGYLKRIYITNKNLEYQITKKGIERKKVLNMSYLKSSHTIYSSAKENILTFINQIISKGYKDIFLYGAGNVAQLLLLVISEDIMLPINVLGIIDDDINKIDKLLVNYPILNKERLNEVPHDGILISSFRNRDIIYNNLITYGYKKENILMFFEM